MLFYTVYWDKPNNSSWDTHTHTHTHTHILFVFSPNFLSYPHHPERYRNCPVKVFLLWYHQTEPQGRQLWLLKSSQNKYTWEPHHLQDRVLVSKSITCIWAAASKRSLSTWWVCKITVMLSYKSHFTATPRTAPYLFLWLNFKYPKHE